MQLDSYFQFVSDDEIVVRGTRVGIEVILADYFAGNLPEEIVCEYPSVTLEHVHATITYYLHNRPEVDKYFQRWVSRGDASLREQATSPLVERLLQARQKASQ